MQEVTATVTSERTEPTCEGEGKIVYTAKVTFEGNEYKDTKTEILDPVHHVWSEPAYVWSADLQTVTASSVCGNDPDHVRTETVGTVMALDPPPTFKTAGRSVYTATFTDELFATQTKEVIIPPTSVTVPTGLSAVYGQTLADVKLPEGWAWDDPLATAVGNAGENAFYATFTSTDGQSTDSISVMLTVSVKKAKPEIADSEKAKAAENLVEEPFDQALVTAPEKLPEGVERIEYSLDGQNWTDEAPTGKTAGDYTVRVRYVGDANHEDLDGEDLAVTIAKAAYSFRTGDGELTYTKDSGAELTATVVQTGGKDASFEHFEGLYIGDAELRKDIDYTVRKGSTVLTVLPAALDGLDVGSHTLTARFTNGEASTQITVLASENDDPTPPQPRDDSHIVLWILLMTISAGALFLVCRRKIFSGR